MIVHVHRTDNRTHECADGCALGHVHDPRVEDDAWDDTPARPLRKPAPVVVRAGLAGTGPHVHERTLSPLGRGATPAGPAQRVHVPDPDVYERDERPTEAPLANPEHEANRHLRNWARLEPENRRLVAAVTVALVRAQVPSDR